MHKPATVSGGGKSEISKRLEYMFKYLLVRSCRVLRVCVLPCVVCVCVRARQVANAAGAVAAT